MMTRCKYCKCPFANKKDLEKHVVQLILDGENDSFCLLMVKQIMLTKWLRYI